jgi:hypothetical protein
MPEMIIRPACLADALRIATIHVEAWQVAYRGIVPDEFLDALSVEERRVGWQRILETGESLTWVAEDKNMALGWISMGRSRDVNTPLLLARFGQYMSIRIIGAKESDARFVLLRSKN